MTNATSTKRNGNTAEADVFDITKLSEGDLGIMLASGKVNAAEFTAEIKRRAMAEAKASVASTNREPSITRIEYVAPGSPTRRGNGQTVYPKLLVAYKATPNSSEAEVFLNVSVWNTLLRSKALQDAVKEHMA